MPPYQDWLRFANRYSSHVAAWFSADRPQEKTAEFWDQFWTPMDKQFQQWVVRNLDGLHNLPPTRPVVTHHIPKFLARKVSAGDKVVLLVLDGLSFSQWKLLKPELDSAHDDILIGEDLCFTFCQASRMCAAKPSTLASCPSTLRRPSPERIWTDGGGKPGGTERFPASPGANTWTFRDSIPI